MLGIAVENAILDRTNRVLETWAAADSQGQPMRGTDGPSRKSRAIDEAHYEAIIDWEFFERYGGFEGQP